MTGIAIPRVAKSLAKRAWPIISRLAGNSPFCPWSSCFSLLNPSVRWSRPPMQITKITQDKDMVLLSFDNRHFWFPRDTFPNKELWNEYLVVFWNSPSNFHYYLKSFSRLNQGDVVIDCGACEGFFVAKALEEGAGKVFAIEPNPLMVRCLERTFEKEIQGNRVVIAPFALGSTERDIYFNFDDGNPFSGKVSNSGLPIKQITLDKLFITLCLQKIDFIKMDLEGLETEALLGGCHLISRFFPKLSISTYHGAEDYYRTFKIIKGFGYKKIQPSGITQRDDSQAYRPYLIHASR